MADTTSAVGGETMTSPAETALIASLEAWAAETIPERLKEDRRAA